MNKTFLIAVFILITHTSFSMQEPAPSLYWEYPDFIICNATQRDASGCLYRQYPQPVTEPFTLSPNKITPRNQIQRQSQACLGHIDLPHNRYYIYSMENELRLFSQQQMHNQRQNCPMQLIQEIPLGMVQQWAMLLVQQNGIPILRSR